MKIHYLYIILNRDTAVVGCCCSHINSHNQVRGHRTGSSHSGAEEYPREKTQTTLCGTWCTHISQLTQFMPPPKTYKSEIGSQSTMCQVCTWCIRLITRAWKNRLYTVCHIRKTTTYILHVVSITTHTHDRRKSIGKKNQRTNMKRKERKGKERKEKKAKKENEKGKERKEKTRKARKGKTRRGSKERNREKHKKKEKHVILQYCS